MVITPRDLGQGIVFNPTTKQWEVPVDGETVIYKGGKLSSPVPTREQLGQFSRDNYRIDYGGGLVEIGGSVDVEMEQWQSHFMHYTAGSNEEYYYREGSKVITLESLGLSSVFSCITEPGDVWGWRGEGSWTLEVNSEHVKVGAFAYFSDPTADDMPASKTPDFDTSVRQAARIKVYYVIKGVKR